MNLNTKRGLALVLMIATVILGVRAQVVFAAYDKPVSWADMRSLDLTRVFQSQYASQTNLLEPVIPLSAQELALRDADSRIDPEFHVPEAMRASVGFWLRIYTEYTTQHVVLFDEDHPDIVYEVMDFRALSRTSRNRAAFEIVSRQRLKKKLEAYRNAFRHLQKNPNTRQEPVSETEKAIFAAIRRTRHAHSWKDLEKNLRTQTGQRDNIVKGLLAAEAFFPKMEEIFRQVGVPPELTRLSLVESSFNLNATSRVGAGGVWQFMPKSAVEYMTMDAKRAIDERMSPLKSTVAAARLLRRNRGSLGNWPLAVTAYNHGVRGIFRLPEQDRRDARTGHIFEACDKTTGKGPGKKQRLGFASRNYYAEFIAILHAEAYRSIFYGESPLPITPPIAFHRVNRPQSGMSFALEKGVSLREFRFYNPDIQNLRTQLPVGFQVALPGPADDFGGMIQTISSSSTKLSKRKLVSWVRRR